MHRLLSRLDLLSYKIAPQTLLFFFHWSGGGGGGGGGGGEAPVDVQYEPEKYGVPKIM